MRIASFLRVLLVGAGALAALGSAAPSERRRQPPPPPVASPGYPTTGPSYCFTLQTPRNTTSMCRPSQEACEGERIAAIGDGLRTSDCVVWQPVACFQLGGDPSPDAQLCAANVEDCELWRQTDLAKNGRTGDPCVWKP